MSKDDKQNEQSEELAVMAPAVRERFLALFEQVPEADPDEATLSIITEILSAQDPDDLDSPWLGQGMRKLQGRVLKVQSIKRLPSEFQGGPGWYLGCDCTLEADGESLFVTSGSVAVMVQLITAHTRGWLPLSVVPRQAERASRKGYFPMHLEVVRKAVG